jgi:hypothetical protein
VCAVPPDHPRLPRNFRDEVELELRAAHRASVQNRARLQALEALHRLSHALELELRRPITAFDVIRSTDDPQERERRRELMTVLRSHAHDTADQSNTSW